MLTAEYKALQIAKVYDRLKREIPDFRGVGRKELLDLAVQLTAQCCGLTEQFAEGSQSEAVFQYLTKQSAQSVESNVEDIEVDKLKDPE